MPEIFQSGVAEDRQTDMATPGAYAASKAKETDVLN